MPEFPGAKEIFDFQSNYSRTYKHFLFENKFS